MRPPCDSISNKCPRYVQIQPDRRAPRLLQRAVRSPGSKQSKVRPAIGAERLPTIVPPGLGLLAVRQATPPNANRCWRGLDLSTGFAHNSLRLLQTSLLLRQCGLRAAMIALRHPVPAPGDRRADICRGAP